MSGKLLSTIIDVLINNHFTLYVMWQLRGICVCTLYVYLNVWACVCNCMCVYVRAHRLSDLSYVYIRICTNTLFPYCHILLFALKTVTEYKLDTVHTCLLYTSIILIALKMAVVVYKNGNRFFGPRFPKRQKYGNFKKSK